MSMCGRLKAEMIARRKEELRKNRVREQCHKLRDILKAKLEKYYSNPKYSFLLKDEALNIEDHLEESENIIKDDPDQALSIIQAIGTELNSSINSVIATEREWAQEKKASYDLLDETIDIIESFSVNSAESKRKLEVLKGKLLKFRDIATTSEELKRLVKDTQIEADSILKADEQEEIRKEIVKRLLMALKKKGFVISKPVLKDHAVHIHGKMPSGKKVLLQVYCEGEIEFDLDGYAGTSCKQEIEAIIEKLDTEGDIKSSIEHYVWHNPDKIKKGVKDFPGNMGQQNYRKKGM